jgi:hypothetical protein
MAEHSRYSVTDAQAGLDGPILENKLDITDPEELLEAETLLLSDAYSHFAELIENHELSISAEFMMSTLLRA